MPKLVLSYGRYISYCLQQQAVYNVVSYTNCCVILSLNVAFKPEEVSEVAVFRSGLQLATYRTDDSVLKLISYLQNAKVIWNITKFYNSLARY